MKPRELVVDGRRISQIISEVTGLDAGVRIEHSDGQIDVIARPGTTVLTPDRLGVERSELRARTYELLRSQGRSHEAATLLMEARHR